MASARMAGTTSYRADRRRSRVTNMAAYVDGNTVRKVYENPWREEELQREHRRQERELKEEKRQLRRALGVQIASVMFMCAVLGMLLFGCVQYLQIQSAVTASVKHINSMESQLEDLRAVNNAEAARVEAAVNLDEIREIAENELGMVYASASQVVQYDKADTNYVRQYADVPDAE